MSNTNYESSGLRLWNPVLVIGGLLLAFVVGCWVYSRMPSRPHWQVSSVAYSPDGKTIAVGAYEWRRAPYADTPRFLMTGLRQIVKLIDAETGAEIALLERLDYEGTVGGTSPEPRSWLDFSPDGSTLAVGTWDGAVRLWDTRSWQLRSTLDCDAGRVRSLAYSPDGRRLAISARRTMTLVDPEDELDPRYILDSDEWFIGGAWSLSFSPDGKRLAASERSKGVVLCDVETARVSRALYWDRPTGDLFTSLDDERYARKRDDGGLSYDRETSEFVAFSPDGATLAVSGLKRGDDMKGVKLVDVESETQVTTFDDLYGPVVFSADGKLLAVAGYRGVHLLNVETSTMYRSFTRSMGALSLDWSPDQKSLVVGCFDGTVEAWDCETGSRKWSSTIR